MDLCTNGGALAAEKRSVSPFLTKFEIQKKILRTNERELENGSYPLQFKVVSKTGLYYNSMDFREVGEWQQTISLMRPILKIKTCFSQKPLGRFNQNLYVSF